MSTRFTPKGSVLVWAAVGVLAAGALGFGVYRSGILSRAPVPQAAAPEIAIPTERFYPRGASLYTVFGFTKNIDTPESSPRAKQAEAIRTLMMSSIAAPSECTTTTLIRMSAVDPCEPVLFTVSGDKKVFVFGFDTGATTTPIAYLLLENGVVRPFGPIEPMNFVPSSDHSKLLHVCGEGASSTLCVLGTDTGIEARYPSATKIDVVSEEALGVKTYDMAWVSDSDIHFSTYKNAKCPAKESSCPRTKVGEYTVSLASFGPSAQ